MPTFASEVLEVVFANSHVGLCLLDVQGRVLMVNAEWRETTGLGDQEVVGASIWQLFPATAPEQRLRHDEARAGRIDCVACHVQRSRGREVRYEARLSSLSLDDGMGLLLTTSGEIKGEGNAALLTDLREQAALREALAESEQLFAAVFAASPMPKLLIRIADRRIVEVNRAYLELAGVTREEVVEQSPDHPAVLSVGPSAEDRARLWGLVAKHGRVSDFEYIFQTRAGERGYAVANVEHVRISGQEFLLVLVQNVTERRRAELALSESATLFRQLTETIHEVFWVSEPNQKRMIYVSPGYERIWGRSCQTLYDDPTAWVSSIHPEDRDRVLVAAQAQLSAGGFDEEYRIVRPDGVVRWLRARSYLMRNDAGQVFRIAGSAQDITERRELELQLRQTQKMESVGLLASGVAHDFNNLLTVVLGNCEALRALLPAHSQCLEVVQEVQEAGERAAALTHQLLAFSRREAVAARVVDFGQVIGETEKLIRRIVGEDVIVTVSSDAVPLRVRVDPGSWVQLVMNLAVNARDAMPLGGELCIETRCVILDESFVYARAPLKPGPHAVLSIRDSGTGIPLEAQTHLFEPFFTTKPVGLGTGLGLSVVHGIVSRNAGHIEFVTHAGVGTTFRIYIPLVDAALDESPAVTIATGANGCETVLIVEDDDAIRRIAMRALHGLGYTLLQAANGVTALSLVEHRTAPIDLLVTDVIMPHMGGRELSEAMRRRYPSIRTLFTSGYTDDAVVRHGIRHAEVAFLSKPYSMSTLAQRVRALLDQGATHR